MFYEENSVFSNIVTLKMCLKLLEQIEKNF